jgi:hypothetical protein
MRKFVLVVTFMLVLVSLLFTPVSAKSETVYIVASKDNTLIENPLGSMSNGSGPYLFVGRTNQQANSLRRGLVHFDVASALPAGAKIRNAQLMLYLSKSGGVTSGISLHRALNDWGQGTSSTTGGSGAPAALDDATWLHTFYPDFFWTTMGGDYVMDASAVITVGPEKGSYTWDNRNMVDDVKSWLMTPEENFGWILIGDEKTPQSVMRFSSREVTCSDKTLSSEVPPILMVTYK